MRISDWSSDVCSSDLRQELSIAQSRAKKSDPDFVDRIGDAPQIPAGDAAIRGPLPGDFQRARLGHRLALVVENVDAAAPADIIHREPIETLHREHQNPLGGKRKGAVEGKSGEVSVN